MTHKSATIECDPRETEIIRSRHALTMVFNLGRGKFERKEIPTTDFEDIRQTVERRSRALSKGARVYAQGKVEGLEIAALYATFIPAPLYAKSSVGTWKFAEAAPEAIQ